MKGAMTEPFAKTNRPPNPSKTIIIGSVAFIVFLLIVSISVYCKDTEFKAVWTGDFS